MIDFKVDKDILLEINRIWIPVKQLREGIEHAVKNKIESVFIWNGGEADEQTINLDLLVKVPFVKSLEIAIPLSKESNIEGIYSLSQLVSLAYFSYDQFPLEHSVFKKLRYLYTHYSKNHHTEKSRLSRLTNLEFLKIWHVNTEDCEFLIGCNKVTNLEITWGSVNALSGLKDLPALSEVKLYGLNKLSDVEDLLLSNSIKGVSIEKCKKLTDNLPYGLFGKIQSLFIDKINSWNGVEKLLEVEHLGFLNTADGNLEPLLKLPKVSEISFYPNKKQYSHTKEALNEMLKERK
ncbi:MAG TPA: hypothetical protein VM802_21920 [Chitinophaga sp.]|uniref:hypothetical protein n=1 Tax=Chitinophaga sp. TaxID=1869181 RepID=UPI002B9290A6|nr:hypothetical protein [Chitinophaga sp.]HVI47543.1 hypothetical protein [Chitinophaga sp.]